MTKRVFKGHKAVYIDMWYGGSPSIADKIDVSFSACDYTYRGNIYKDGKMIGDYSTTDSVALEKAFPQLVFNW